MTNILKKLVLVAAVSVASSAYAGIWDYTFSGTNGGGYTATVTGTITLDNTWPNTSYSWPFDGSSTIPLAVNMNVAITNGVNSSSNNYNLSNFIAFNFDAYGTGFPSMIGITPGAELLGPLQGVGGTFNFEGNGLGNIGPLAGYFGFNVQDGTSNWVAVTLTSLKLEADASTPEPGSIALTGAALLGGLMIARRRRLPV